MSIFNLFSCRRKSLSNPKNPNDSPKANQRKFSSIDSKPSETFERLQLLIENKSNGYVENSQTKPSSSISNSRSSWSSSTRPNKSNEQKSTRSLTDIEKLLRIAHQSTHQL